MKIFSKPQIIAAMDVMSATGMIKEGFIALSQGRIQMPPVQNLEFVQANGDCCVKSAHILGEPTFVVKIATGFYSNPVQGLESNNGLMLVFSAVTGQPLALLRDEGWLTSLRTALAGQIAARVLAPLNVQAIGIVGTGVQARMQLEDLMPVTSCRQLIVWGRNQSAPDSYQAFAQNLGFCVETTRHCEDLAQKANLIITTTPSREALLQSAWIRPGTHITAVGADGFGKQELGADLVAKADIICVDSINQCRNYGEVSHALRNGLIDLDQVTELGKILTGEALGRQSDDQITVVDLTGVAVQDAQICHCALEALEAA